MFRVNCITGALTVLSLGEQGSIGKLPEQAVQFLAQEGGVFVDPPLLPLLIISSLVHTGHCCVPRGRDDGGSGHQIDSAVATAGYCQTPRKRRCCSH